MGRQVWKWTFTDDLRDLHDGAYVLNMPYASHVLCVQAMYDQLCLWALVDPSQPIEPRRFCIFATRQEIAYELEWLDYVGTYNLYDGTLVLHVFEIMETDNDYDERHREMAKHELSKQSDWGSWDRRS